MSTQAKDSVKGHPPTDEESSRSYFSLKIEDLTHVIEGYRQRTFCEDLDRVEALGNVEGIISKLKTNVATGLPIVDIDERIKTFGTNRKDPPVRTPYWKFFIKAIDDFMLKLLLVCACVNIGFEVGFADPHDRSHAWIEGFAIFLAVFIVVFVGSYNDYKKEEQFFALYAQDQGSKRALVRRQGHEVEIHPGDIVVGDIVKITAGMDVPVDGLVLSGASGILCNESAMTGESDELKKEDVDACLFKKHEKLQKNPDKDIKKFKAHDVTSPILLSGTQIQTGEGWYVCLVVGKHSCAGKIQAKLEQNSEEMTPLQVKLEQIGEDLGKLGMYAAIFTLHILLLRFFIEKFQKRAMNMFGEDPKWHSSEHNLKQYFIEWLKYLVVAIAIIVVAVPEGLPLAVMITLAYSVRKMLVDQNFVKKLASCEIMGGANNICSDKTGTLTTNQMTITSIFVGNDVKVPFQSEKYDWNVLLPNRKHQLLVEQAMCCNTSGSEEHSSATEKAMIKFMNKLGLSIETVRKQFLPEKFIRFQFTSGRKRMSTICENCQDSDYDYKKRVHMKGAAEIVLAACSSYIDQQGNRQPLNDSLKQAFIKQINTYASQTLRTISFAYKDLRAGEGGSTHDNQREGSPIYEIEEEGFTLICIVGIKDVIRNNVPAAVATCKSAGITVRMVTGDNLITAKAIAMECGILTQDDDQDCVMEGPEFYTRMGGLKCLNCSRLSPCDCNPRDVKEGVMNLDAFKNIHHKLKVLARSRPEDKYLLVTGLKELGDVVAVTGDGTNDAPALKKADVGFAMGITGTEIAKHAADIIIMDDNFASIVQACKWGRNIYDNIRKFLQFQITVSLVALNTAFIGSVVLKDSPLQAIQLLWVNLIIDSLAALALATEPPTEKLLRRAPQSREEYIISKDMLKQIIPMAAYMLAILWTICFAGEYFFPEPTLEYRYDRQDIPYVYPGRPFDWDGETELFIKWKKVHGASRHLSNVFNIFVVMSIFNIINARIIDKEKNIFAGVHRNLTFCVIFLFISVAQVIIVEFGGLALKISEGGLHGYHWLIAVILGFTTWIMAFFFKFIPDSWCPQFGKKNNQTSDAAQTQKQGSLSKKPASIVHLVRGGSSVKQAQIVQPKDFHLEKKHSNRAQSNSGAQ